LPRALPNLSIVARNWQQRNKVTLGISEQFINNSLKCQGAIDAVERILKYGRNELNQPLRNTLWFRQQLRLTADLRLKEALTTGASQVSKSLANYLCLNDQLINGQINAGWFYASRQSMYNQQPEQFQKLIMAWLNNVEKHTKIERDSVARFTTGKATANFSYANSSSQGKAGGASEGKEQASFQASILYLEEKSSWDSLVDVSPRLGASTILSKPIRQLGTPGSGAGIERDIENAAHLFVPGLICKNCKQITFLDPKGALLKPVYDEKRKEERYFNSRGQILDYHSLHGTPESAYVACIHCNSPISAEEIDQCQLYSKVTLETADEFLDALPDDQVYIDPIAIYLSPLLRIPTDPYRVVELIREGLDPPNPKIYQENKLGHASVTGSMGVSLMQYQKVYDKAPIYFTKKVRRFLGVDQGTDFHYAVVIETADDEDISNILFASSVSENDIIETFNYFSCDYAVMDVDPYRKSALELSQKVKNFVLADQRSIDIDFKPIKVKQGSVEIPCFAINNQLYIETVISNWTEEFYRINGKIHPNFKKNITSIKRNIQTGLFERPADHDDDLFFALMFAEVAKAMYKINHKPPSGSAITGRSLKTIKFR
jgi:hypothetical protein